MIKVYQKNLILLLCFLFLISCFILKQSVETQLNFYDYSKIIHSIKIMKLDLFQFLFTDFSAKTLFFDTHTYMKFIVLQNKLYEYECIKSFSDTTRKIAEILKTIVCICISNFVSSSSAILFALFKGIKSGNFLLYIREKLPIIQSELEDFRRGIETDIWFSHVWTL